MRFVAGRGAVAERLVRCTAVAERHREDVAYCSTADAELLLAREPPAQRTAGRDVVAELLLAGNHRHRGPPAGAPWQRKGAVQAQAPLRSQLAGWPGHCCVASALPRVCGTEQALLRSKGAAAEQERWHRARAPLRSRGAGRKQELARGVRS